MRARAWLLIAVGSVLAAVCIRASFDGIRGFQADA